MNESIQQRRPNPIWTAIVCGMASYIDAASIVSYGTVLVIYQVIFHLTPGQVGILSGVLTFSIAIGALSGGYLGDRFGRRRVFIFTMIGVMIGIVGMILTSAFSFMLPFTVLVGLSTGADLPVSLTTIAETSKDEKQRGTLLGLSQILWLFGIIGTLVLTVFVGNLGRTGAQIILGQVGVISILILLGRLSIPESDVWKEANAAKKSGIQTQEKASVGQLFHAPYAAPFIALLLFYGLCNAAYNVVGQYGTYILVNVIKVDVAKASSISLMTFPFGLIGALLFMKTVRSSRRILYFLLGAIVTAVGFFLPVLLGITEVNYIIASIFMGLGSCFAGEAMMKIWCQESFPTMYRATAQGSVIAFGRVTAALFAFVVPLIIAFSPAFLYFCMSVMCLAGGLIAWAVFHTRDSQSKKTENKTAECENEPMAAIK